jgi:hypothetical protein
MLDELIDAEKKDILNQLDQDVQKRPLSDELQFFFSSIGNLATYLLFPSEELDHANRVQS